MDESRHTQHQWSEAEGSGDMVQRRSQCETHAATHCNTLQYTATQCNTRQHSATHCNTLQHTAAHCNTHFNMTWYKVAGDMSHVTLLIEQCSERKSRHTYDWVTSHIWMSHITHMNESHHTYEWVTSQIWINHGTHMNESRHTYEWAMSRIEWVTSHIWLSHVTHINASRHTYEWVMSHIWMSYVTSHTIPGEAKGAIDIV